MIQTHVIKRSGKRPTESFDREKLKASLKAACLSVKTPEGQAEMTSEIIVKQVEDWLMSHPEVTSNDIRLSAARFLKVHDPEAAYIYEQHKITL